MKRSVASLAVAIGLVVGAGGTALAGGTFSPDHTATEGNPTGQHCVLISPYGSVLEDYNVTEDDGYVYCSTGGVVGNPDDM